MASTRLLNRKEAARHLGVPEKVIVSLRRAGLPCIRVGRVFRYPDHWLDAYASGQLPGSVGALLDESRKQTALLAKLLDATA